MKQLTNVPAFQWYRVTDCDTEPEQVNVNLGGTTTRNKLYATLMGQDWNKDVVDPRFGATASEHVSSNDRAKASSPCMRKRSGWSTGSAL